MTKKPKIELQWNGMKCKTCNRLNSDGICDFYGKQNEINYCEDFIPKSNISKDKILQMWSYHQRRFIIERREYSNLTPCPSCGFPKYEYYKKCPSCGITAKWESCKNPECNQNCGCCKGKGRVLVF